MLRLPDAWVWDSWYLDTGEHVHAFYLKASRALLDTDRRHHRASVGHSVSSDLITWTELPDALVHSDAPAFDDLATWTGSTIAGGDGAFHLYYTGISREFGDRRQVIGHAVSTDLLEWERTAAPVIVADPRWYATLGTGRTEHWRDPWVFRDEEADAWRMLITAEACRHQPPAAGCIATATSSDLVDWTVEPPLAVPGFGQLEVTQVVQIDGSWVLVWCMQAADFPDALAADGRPPISGTWTAPADSPTGPYRFDAAEPIRIDGLYAGRIVLRDGIAHLFAFVDRGADGRFGGWITDPIALALTERGTLQPRR